MGTRWNSELSMRYGKWQKEGSEVWTSLFPLKNRAHPVNRLTSFLLHQLKRFENYCDREAKRSKSHPNLAKVFPNPSLFAFGDTFCCFFSSFRLKSLPNTSCENTKWNVAMTGVTRVTWQSFGAVLCLLVSYQVSVTTCGNERALIGQKSSFSKHSIISRVRLSYLYSCYILTEWR